MRERGWDGGRGSLRVEEVRMRQESAGEIFWLVKPDFLFLLMQNLHPKPRAVLTSTG